MTRKILAGTPEGADALALARRVEKGGDLLHIARDDFRMARLLDALTFFAPDAEILEFPAWDCVPYDRVSPHVEIIAKRVETLAKLAGRGAGGKPRIVLTTVAAVMQRLAPIESFAEVALQVSVGRPLDMTGLQAYLQRHGYNRADTVMEPGEYALRGGLVDLFPPGSSEPLRIDLFGDDVEDIRSFDPMSQRSTGKLTDFALLPAGEVTLDETSIQRFRTRYRELFGPVTSDDPLYEAVSAGIKFAGMEHWLPLFHDGLDDLFAYLPDAQVTLDPQIEEARAARAALVEDYYQARLEAPGTGEMPYRPVPPKMLHLEADEWNRAIDARAGGQLWPFAPAENAPNTIDEGARQGHNFADLRATPGANVYDGVVKHVAELRAAGKQVVIAAWSEGSADRMGGVLEEHGLKGLKTVSGWKEAEAASQPVLAVLGIEHGFALR